MEAAALGAAKSALNSVLQITTTAITHEIGLVLGVEEELFFIKEELQMMRSFLRVAKTENLKGDIVTTWIKQVEELAFDVEDCLQEATVHLMKKSCLPLMCSVKKRGDIARKIRVLKTRIEDVSKRNLRYGLITMEKGSHPNDESASTRSIANVEVFLVGLDKPKRELVDLVRKEEVISVVGMGGLGKTTLVREIFGWQELRNEFNHFAWVTVQHPFNKEEFIESLAKQIPSNLQEVDDKGEGEKMEGRDPKKTKTKTKDGNKKKLEVLSIKSIKESLEKKVKEYLKDKKYLIVLDDLSCFSEWEKIRDVLALVNGSQIIVTTRLRSLAESLSHSSDNIYEIKKLSTKDAFDLFCKIVYKSLNYHIVRGEGPSCTQIMVEDNKVQKQRIANTITEEKAIEKKDDKPDESMYNNKSGPSSTEIMEEESEVQQQYITITITEDMNTQANLIIESCGRLPLAIVTIGSYLATKPKTGVEWKEMYDRLNSELNNNPDLGVVKNVLTSSYDGLPYHLKPCLLYLSVFHNHKEIRRSRIVRRWIADGYGMEGCKSTAEEVGKGNFNYLMGRSLIQPSQMSTIVNEDVKKCNIHDLMFELILGKAVDDSMVSLLENKKLRTKTDKVRHLVIVSGPCTGDKVLERVNLSHMRSVSIFGEVGDYLRFPRMKLVRVLDLEDTLKLNNQSLRSIGELRLLKYLGLRGTEISELPDSLGMLSELETLDIRNTAVARLPIGLKNLDKLSYLRAGFDSVKNPDINPMARIKYSLGKIHSILQWPFDRFDASSSTIAENSFAFLSFCAICCAITMLPYTCYICYVYSMDDCFGSYGVQAPREIGELRSLSILGTIDIGQSNSLAKELQNLTNLSKLSVTGFSEKNGKTLAKVIDDLEHLRSLVLSATNDLGLKCCLESVSSPPKYLQSLKLYSPLGELPDWISFLENLEKIHFRNTLLTKEIKAIEKLPYLKVLHMLHRSFVCLKELCFGEGTFPMLQVMIIEGARDLESVSIKMTALKRLEVLKISECRDITKGGVSGLDYLVQLKEMVVGFSGDNEINKTFVRNLQKQLKKVPKRPVLRVIKT